MAKTGSKEFEKFDHTMRKLIAVPHSQLKAMLDAEKAAKSKRGNRRTTQRYRLLGPVPKPHCPVCNADIDVSKAKYSVPLSICHGQVTVNPERGTLVGIVDFCISSRDSESQS